MLHESIQKNMSCTMLSENIIICNGTKFEKPEEALTSDSTEFWIYLGVYIFLMLFAGLMSGLTLGLLSLDQTQLEILKTAGKPKERKYAERIWPMVKRHHLLLVTLLLANAGAVESMPIFMDKITNPVVAIVISVTAVLIFGEIIPQSLCSRYGLAIGYYLAPLVYLLMFLFFIIAWPISKLLDCLLGANHGTYFRRSELKALVDVHKRTDSENEEPLSIDEALIIQGALDMKNKVAKDALIPLDSVFMLESDTKLDVSTMDKILEIGHSRIPIYEGSRQNIIGILLVKTAIKLDPDDGECVRTQMRSDNLLTFKENEPLYNILNAFQTGKSHICMIKKSISESDELLSGILTLEDLMEEILQEEIIDETDQYEDVVKRIKVARLRRKLSRSLNLSRYTPSNPESATNSIKNSDRKTADSRRSFDGRSEDEKAPLLSVPQI